MAGAQPEQRRRRRANGEGSITQLPDGRWMARLDCGWSDGRRVRRAFFARTRAEAAGKLSKALADRDRGLPVALPKQTVVQFLSRWLDESVTTSVRPRTATRYRELVELHILPTLGRTSLTKLTPQDLRQLYAAKLAEGLAPRTVGHIHRVLHHALGQALRWDLVARNVCDAVDPPRVTRTEIRALNPDEARHFLAAAVDDPLEALYVLALTTGMRQGELLGLKWQDIDLDNGALQVRRTIGRVRGQGFVESEPKSAKGRRHIALAPSTTNALRRHRERQFAERLTAGMVVGGESFVFCNGLGRPIEPQNLLYRSFHKLLQRADLPRMRFHDLRHSAASLLLSMGIHPKVVQELLGHSQISLTLDTYSHVLPGLQRQAVDDLGALLATERP
jgi:integrase